ncbi:MAG: alpha/beta fold hydrolase [Solirubrobacteraceae bacterium]
MPQITTPHGIRLEYETAGRAEDPAVLMVMGFGAQLVSWPREFCEMLAAGGRHVISFDNRDCGMSQTLDGVAANLEAVGAAAQIGDFKTAQELAPYTLSDMAEDGLGLLAALGIDRAHVVGASMGGMIAQTMAIEHPERLWSLTSMMSATGEPEYGQATPEALAKLLEPSPTDREGYIASSASWLTWHSRRYPEAAQTRAIAAETFDRGLSPEGTQRQLAAMLTSGPRTAGLRQVNVPTLVIHGLDDTLVAPSGGERTAKLIPNAKLMLVKDMGHDRPRPLWPALTAAIIQHTSLT